MNKCRHCKEDSSNENSLFCPDCTAIICKDCAIKSKNICPFCFSNLENYK